MNTKVSDPIQANAPAKPSEVNQSTPSGLPDGPMVRPDFSGRRLKLGARPIKGYHLCWINDTGTNVEENMAIGYTCVTRAEQGVPMLPGQTSDNLGDSIRRPVGTQEDGSPMYAYLMKIPDLLFSEGMRNIDARNKAVQDSLRRTFKQARGLGESRDEEAGVFYAPPSNTYESQSSRSPPEKR